MTVVSPEWRLGVTGTNEWNGLGVTTGTRVVEPSCALLTMFGRTFITD